MAEISADVRLKTIVRHFLGDRDAYMTTRLPEINGCIPDIARVSDYGSSPHGGNFRLIHNLLSYILLLFGKHVSTTQKDSVQIPCDKFQFILKLTSIEEVLIEMSDRVLD